MAQRILVFSAAFKGAGQGAVYCARPGKVKNKNYDICVIFSENFSAKVEKYDCKKIMLVILRYQ